MIILGENSNCACQLLQEAYITWLIFQEQKNHKRRNGGEQDGGGVGGCAQSLLGGHELSSLPHETLCSGRAGALDMY